MSSQLNVSVLVAARDEYTNQLKKHLVPLIQEGFVSIYDDSVEENEYDPVEQFRLFLKEVPRWNQTILDQETKRIKDKCPFMMDCVTAIFVSHVKILASVRLGGNHSNIRIKIPTPEIFTHSVYVSASEIFYYEPEPFKDLLDRKNVECIRDIIETSIDDTISGMIPIQNILQEYLSNTFTEHVQPPTLPDPVPELPGDILTGSDILDEPATFDIGQNLNDGYASDASEKSSLNDLFDIKAEPDSELDTNFTNEIKEISLGDEKISDDPIFPEEDKMFEDKLPDNELPVEETKQGGFDPLSYLGIGTSDPEPTSGGDSFDGVDEGLDFSLSDDNKSPADDSGLDEQDFNFFDDSSVNF